MRLEINVDNARFLFIEESSLDPTTPHDTVEDIGAIGAVPVDDGVVDNIGSYWVRTTVDVFRNKEAASVLVRCSSSCSVRVVSDR